MILCIPVEKYAEGSSPIHGHFGSAPFFLLHDVEKGTYENLPNSNLNHEHGQCNPMKTIEGRGVGAVLCQGMGRKAVERLNAGGVKVLVSEALNAADVVESFKKGLVHELQLDEACGGHAHHGSEHGCHS